LSGTTVALSDFVGQSRASSVFEIISFGEAYWACDTRAAGLKLSHMKPFQNLTISKLRIMALVLGCLACSRSKFVPRTEPVELQLLVSAPFTFVVYGDARFHDPKDAEAANPPVRQLLVQAIAKASPKFISFAGDIVYNGYDKAIFNDEPADSERQKSLLSRLRLDKPYILHHGVIQPRKNLKRLIEAWRLLCSRNPNLEFDLVLAGPRGWEYNDILAAASNGAATSRRVVFPGVLDDPDLAMLIKGASLVVMPSLYEGFCLPMVEAMACGVPTIASNNSCLPEISGGVLRYFDPLSIDEMAACMEQALEDDALRQRLIQEGKKRASYFDWATCAAKTLAILEGCIDA